LTIFDHAQKRKETLDYLSGMIRLAAKLGAKVLVFGSPKNRRVGNLSEVEIERIAVPFFRALGQVAMENEVTFCIEPNPTVYDCDFITTSRQGLELVLKVNSQGFGLHLDAAALTLSQEPIESAIEAAFGWLQHFHISEPQLAQIGTGRVDHGAFATTLARLHYKSWVSIEMRAEDPDLSLVNMISALKHCMNYYG
jgi:sugar phosphate isomerase/epimerase